MSLLRRAGGLGCRTRARAATGVSRRDDRERRRVAAAMGTGDRCSGGGSEVRTRAAAEYSLDGVSVAGIRRHSPAFRTARRDRTLPSPWLSGVRTLSGPSGAHVQPIRWPLSFRATASFRQPAASPAIAGASHGRSNCLLESVLSSRPITKSRRTERSTKRVLYKSSSWHFVATHVFVKDRGPEVECPAA